VPDSVVLTFAVNALVSILWSAGELPSETAAADLHALMVTAFYPAFQLFPFRCPPGSNEPGKRAWRVCEALGVTGLMAPHVGKRLVHHDEKLLVHEAGNILSAIVTVGAEPSRVKPAWAI
jgi:hypothetical protein